MTRRAALFTTVIGVDLAEARGRGATIVTGVAVPDWSYDDIRTCAGGGSLYVYRGNAPPVDDAT